MDNSNLEVWQRGPIEGVPDLLQPVAHALLQAKEDARRYTEQLPEELLWEKPYGVASVGFHLNHLSGVINRLFTYADNRKLSADLLRLLMAVVNPDLLPLVRAESSDGLEEGVEEAGRNLREPATV